MYCIGMPNASMLIILLNFSLVKYMMRYGGYIFEGMEFT